VVDRNKPKRLLPFIVAAVVACGVVVAGCGDSDSSTDSEAAVAPSGIEIPKQTIAYIEPAAVDEVTNRNVTQMKEAAKELGWELNFTNAQGDFAKVISATEAAVNAGVDAIVLGSTDAKLVRQPLLNAEKAEIPAIVIGGGVEEDPLYVAQYTEDEPLMSKLLTERMVEDLNGKGKVAAMEITQLSSGVERADAREEVLEGTDVELVDSKEGDLADPVQGTKKNASALISANPDLDAMWLVYDYMMPPTLETMTSLGDKTTEIYTWFAGPENVERLRDTPQVRALIENNFDHTGLIAMDQLAAHADGADINPEALAECPLKYDVIEKENAPPPGELTWPLPENLAPFVANWKDGKFGEGADCGTEG
jgi:ABC-type sugar transport system substrate-binding protein